MFFSEKDIEAHRFTEVCVFLCCVYSMYAFGVCIQCVHSVCEQLALSSVWKFKSNRQLSCEGDFIYIAISMCFLSLFHSFALSLPHFPLHVISHKVSNINSDPSISLPLLLALTLSLPLSHAHTHQHTLSIFHVINYFILF